jgi:hypothetical protein
VRLERRDKDTVSTKAHQQINSATVSCYKWCLESRDAPSPTRARADPSVESGSSFPAAAKISKLFDDQLERCQSGATRHTTANMAKKRKAGGRAYGDAKAPKNDESKLAINSWEDVADSEDEFLLNREKVMLDEGPAAKRLRKHQEEGKTQSVCNFSRAY